MAGMNRVVMHIDMDSFFAQIEERENPEIAGKPVIICVFSGRGEGIGAVSTSNYHARNQGIKAGMPCGRAKKLSPEGIYLPSRKDFYKEVSDQIMEIINRYGDAFEQVSIDEAYLEVTHGGGKDIGKAENLAIELKEEIKNRTSLNSSVGIGPNKLIAKMASAHKKPDGLCIVRPNEVNDFLGPMPVKKLYGVGKKTAGILQEDGIETIRDLRERDPLWLIEKLGKARGKKLFDYARGIDPSPVISREKEQFGRMMSFPEDTDDSEIIIFHILELGEDIISKIREKGYQFRTVTFTGITPDYISHTKSLTLDHPVSEKIDFFEVSEKLIMNYLSKKPEKLRRGGITVSNFSRPERQSSLIDY